MARHDLVDPHIPEVEALSATADRIYKSYQYHPSFGRRGGPPTLDDAKLLGLHSLYHLCRIVLLCPLVSLFSGHRQQAPTVADNGPANAAIVAEHALLHCRLIREYILASCDIRKISPLTAFASFVASSVLLTLVKSSRRRCPGAHGESRRTLLQLSRYVRDTSNVLTILQMYWLPLRPMVSRYGRIWAKMSAQQTDQRP